jgi:hypothetical protein
MWQSVLNACSPSSFAFSLTLIFFFWWLGRHGLREEKRYVMLDHACLSTSPVWEMRQQTLEQTGRINTYVVYLYLYQD